MRSIRPATISDAAALARFAERTFRETFAGDNSPADMAAHCAEHYRADIQAREIADPARLTLVSEEASALIGYTQMRWGPAPACVIAAAPGEIQRLYVAQAWHGKGVAHELMDACRAAMIRT